MHANLPVPWMGSELPGLGKPRHGKVRDVYTLGEFLLLVATDRLSAFDVVLPDGIPLKGRVLTQTARFWFEKLGSLVRHHLVTTVVEEMPPEVRPHAGLLEGRAAYVRRAIPLPVEFIVRGYLAGSGWAEYASRGSVCGIELPPRLLESEALPAPILTPTTKAQEGHDENLSRVQYAELLGDELAQRCEAKALELYAAAHAIAAERGIILADTKLEFGLLEGDLILIDEIFTPDSSRFWPKDDYEPGRPQLSFDKQFVRDHLIRSGWNRRPPPPRLPSDIIRRTAERYVEIFERLTGERLLPPG
ncbi:MAG: phosphoribosylaminoimidazolesuccinocarboxamide synthase [Planctomycetota bacterium]